MSTLRDEIIAAIVEQIELRDGVIWSVGTDEASTAILAIIDRERAAEREHILSLVADGLEEAFLSNTMFDQGARSALRYVDAVVRGDAAIRTTPPAAVEGGRDNG